MSNEEKPKRSRRPSILGIVGALAACGIISIMAALFSDGGSADPEPTVAAVAIIDHNRGDHEQVR